mmetsp:Transcript_27109/g.30224  ORF Transcript_27109/g.30224 Transcript_27109/m.30224 type:complete len:198 (+) Transcript_27109:48-641(+)|eukprot:CAMPEP_0168519076 /NCGR_PEP_ID=MMETSP0405-20121227/7100_1 /TAXON_ID=498012 /ORGANISM="Trichosphaerium sp, Strain Am-I-7 wt" /LENGTH=197 /DNA_ID=CAMNT_0008539545 /DNA_START=48 /DNA_END=641 /DNA_ORIENTATION=+
MATFAVEVKLFNKWSYDGLKCDDISLSDYIATTDRSQYRQFLPHTAGRWQKRRFIKSRMPIVERLVNAMMSHGRNNGKKCMAIRIVKQTLEIIHLMSGENPIQVLVVAVQKGGAREDSTRVGSAGTVRRQAVDVAPQRRVDQALYLMCQGARKASFRTLKSIGECLADEIMNCAKESVNSYAIKQKDSIERVAQSNR